MHKKTLLFTLIVMTTLYAASCGQQTQTQHNEAQQDSGQLPPDFIPAEVMQRHGIALTTPSLVDALRNPEELVREAAAMDLVSQKAVDAIPAMVVALNEEKTRRVQMNMAFLAVKMGEEREKEAGLNALQSICDDKNALAGDRLQAAGYSLDFGKEGCLNDVIEILQTPQTRDTDFQDEMKGLSLLPRFEHASDYDSQRILTVAAALLSSSDPAVRMRAADALARRRDKSAIESLKHAMTIEQNEMVRSSMSNSLNALAQAH